MDVVLAALSLQGLQSLPPMVLCDVVIKSWHRCVHLSTHAKAKATRTTARAAAVKVRTRCALVDVCLRTVTLSRWVHRLVCRLPRCWPTLSTPTSLLLTNAAQW